MVVTTTLSFTLHLLLLVSGFQSIVSLTVPSSASRMPAEAEMDLKKDSELPLFANTRRQKDTPASKEYIVKTFFLIDNTTEQEEAQERIRLQSILDGINLKLKTQGAFDGYHFQIKVTEVAFQKDFYEKEDPILQVQFQKWNTEFPQRFPNRDVDAALLLTKRSHFQGFQRLAEKSSLEEEQKRLQETEEEHVQYWSHFPMLYNQSSPLVPFPTVTAPIYFLGIIPKDAAKFEEDDQKRRQKKKAITYDEEGFASRYVLGTMGGFTICNNEMGSGVVSGYGDMKYLNVFEGIFVHEFFHGFGLHHDPLFIKECVGYTMNDGVDMNTPIGFSPCSKKAMDFLKPHFPCLAQQDLHADSEALRRAKRDEPTDMTEDDEVVQSSESFE